MFKTEEDKLYFEKDYPNFQNILLQHRNVKKAIHQYSNWSEESILNSKIMVFQNGILFVNLYFQHFINFLPWFEI